MNLYYSNTIPIFKNLIVIASLILVCVACNSSLVEPDPKAGAPKNFEIFWSDIYNTYPYFEKDKVDWLKVYDDYRYRVNDQTTEVELFGIFKSMLSMLSDEHKSLESADKKLTYFSQRRQYYTNYDSNNVFKTYLNNNPQRAFSLNESDPPKSVPVADFGITNDSILYYHVRTYFTKFSFEKSFDAFSRSHPGAKGLILDLRNNLGGDIATLLNFMGIFFENSTDYIIIKRKTGPLDNNFSAPENYTIKPSTAFPIFKKPIVVLATRYTASAGEHTVLAMTLRNGTSIVGDTTFGAFSFVLQRTLPNGMQFECVSNQTTDIHGTNYEGIGIPPQVYTVLTQANYSKNKDDLMEKAIGILNK